MSKDAEIIFTGFAGQLGEISTNNFIKITQQGLLSVMSSDHI